MMEIALFQAKIAILANFGEYCTRSLVEGSRGLAKGTGTRLTAQKNLLRALEDWLMPDDLAQGSRDLAQGSGGLPKGSKGLAMGFQGLTDGSGSLAMCFKGLRAQEAWLRALEALLRALDS